MEASSRRWNHNFHYHRLILDAVPANDRSGLDVDCSNGLLSLDMRRVMPEVTGIDVDDAVLDEARQQSDEVTWILGNAMTHEFGRQFDVVASVARLSRLRRAGRRRSPAGQPRRALLLALDHSGRASAVRGGSPHVSRTRARTA